MPPLYAQDPLDALELAAQHRWLDVLALVVAVACEPWALALLGLALYAWLEREVPSVLKAVLPLAAALLGGALLAAGARLAWGGPRLLGAGEAPSTGLQHLLPSGPALALATFVTYSLLVYRRRAAAVLVLLALGVGSRVVAGPHWAADLVGGGVVGGALGAGAWAAALRVFPEGPQARARAPRRTAPDGAGAPGSPPLP
jgi:membrane-associated phospholipid phosphatase